MARYYADGRWVALLEYIDGLPSASRLNEAIMNDPEAAAHLADLSVQDEGEKKPYAPRIAEWDVKATLLREVADGIKVLTATLVSVNGGKPRDVKPFPTPTSALGEALREAEHRWAVDFGTGFGFSPEDF